ncbi:hypothetical protein PI95_031115 [Hassallia byssoidea VB512170]|uniref:Uncharacterized protein n=1 Tax=Hassallia byssoidea VB512170 TaxID=1304833 RepID=A0A846HJY6_9CYAN|nr:hypothetical protein [Hassalia byssoidea]NEU76840.1 hypothetical protein [Hassalia byssoidea VB512170]
MAMMFDGTTDSVLADVLNSIRWEIRYNTLCGICDDTPSLAVVIPGADSDENGVFQSEGAFSIINAPAAGNQKTTIAWYRDEGQVRFRIVEVTRAH